MIASRKSKRIAMVAGLGVAVVIGLSWDQIAEWYRFHQVFESIGKNVQGMPEYRHRQSEE